MRAILRGVGAGLGPMWIALAASTASVWGRAWLWTSYGLQGVNPWSAKHSVLGVLLFVACVSWTVARARRAVSGASGAGLSLAVYGFACLIVVEFRGTPDLLPDSDPLVWAHLYGGFAAYVLGLLLVAEACRRERRERRAGRWWTMLS